MNRTQSSRWPDVRWTRRVSLRTLSVAGLALPIALATAQQPSAPAFNENVVFLDAAHGGTDAGAHLGGTVDEKDVTLALAARLKSALAAKGFYVVLSRDADTTLTAEQRAGIANHARPLACILLHAGASGSGAGAVLAVSALTPEVEQRPALPWATAQASSIPESLALRDLIAAALTSAKLKPVPLRASTPPIDSLTCAAVTIELLGPPLGPDEDSQQKLAAAVAQAALAWKAQAVAAKAASSPASSPAAATSPAGARP